MHPIQAVKFRLQQESDVLPRPLQITKLRHQRNSDINSRQGLAANGSWGRLQQLRHWDSTLGRTKDVSLVLGNDGNASFRHRNSITPSKSSKILDRLNKSNRRCVTATPQCTECQGNSTRAYVRDTLSSPYVQPTSRRSKENFLLNKNGPSQPHGTTIDNNHPPQPRRRAVTTGSFPPQRHLCSICKELSYPITPTSPIGQRRSEQVITEASYIEGAQRRIHEKASVHDQGRYGSLTRKLVSGMMHRFTSKCRMAMNHDKHKRASDEKPMSQRKPIILPAGSKSRNRTSTLSDTSSVLKTSSEFEDTIASFPSPPKSTATSLAESSSLHVATAISTNSCGHSDDEDIAILGADVNAICEIDRIDFEDNPSVFVAVEIKGTLNRQDSQYSHTRQRSALDIILIIDNSWVLLPLSGGARTYSFNQIICIPCYAYG